MKQKLIELDHYLRKYRFTMNNEKELQRQIFTKLSLIGFQREFALDRYSVIDFYNPDTKIGIEIKNKGGAKAILKQCERYTAYNEIQGLVLATNRSIGFPNEICGKSVLVCCLGEAWL